MTEGRTVVIVNPKSAAGKTGGAWERVRKSFADGTQVMQTTGRGHAIELASAALRNGAKTIIAVGGDGTINEVVNGFFADDQLINKDAVLGIIPAGTSSDLRRSLNLPLDQNESAFVTRHGVARPLDVMRVRYTTDDGKFATRYALNVISFGMGGLVAAQANRSSKKLGGNISMVTATLRSALSYAGKAVTVILDNSRKIERRVTNVAVGNGQYHGAGMHVCPKAELDDGLLDVTVIEYVGVFELIANLKILFNGRILEHPRVQSHRARHVRAESSERTLIEVDGEPLGRLPIEIEVIPKAIAILG